MKMDPNNVNTKEFWDRYLSDRWEGNSGRQQTRLFAKYFLEVVRLPESAATLLDMGCAMGDAIPEFHKKYPNLELHGCDVSPAAIARAHESYGELARFHSWGFEEIRGHFDVIYCSNLLEHFERYLEIAADLLLHCTWLYVLVPYREYDRERRPLSVKPGQQHVVTFDRRSFNQLVRLGYAESVRSWWHPCPVAWGPPDPSPRWKRMLKEVRNRFTGRRRRPELSQVFFEITASGPR
jgi:hypothetical protein